MKRYRPDQYSLVEINTNAIYYYALAETETDRWFVFEWDLSASEINDIIRKFQDDGLTENDFQREIEWQSEDLVDTDWVISFRYLDELLPEDD